MVARIAALTALIPIVTALGEAQIDPDPNKVVPPVTHNSPVTYNGPLVNTSGRPGSGIQGTTDFQNIDNPATWEYYSFSGSAGDLVTIQVHRTTNAMDPALMVCFGTTNDSAGISAFTGCGPQMGPFVASADDNNGIPHGVGGQLFDPKAVFTLPLTGTYTLMVFDFFGAGPNPEFEIHVGGIRRDSDGDGIPDNEDLCPFSDPNPTVVIGGFDSGVANVNVGDGCNVGDEIAEIAATAPTRIHFLIRVIHRTIRLAREGFINRSEQRSILIAAFRASLHGTL